MFVLLHNNPELLDAVCDLLNAEWPRSKSARINSLSGSCDNLPLSVLFVSNLKSKDCEVLGHAKVTKLPSEHQSCWIESVLIHPNYRGKGLGKELMLYCEDIARKKGFKTAYLSTHDKQGFYASLGYEFCTPVSQFGGCRIFPFRQRTVVEKSQTSNKELSLSPSKGAVPPCRIPPPPPLATQENDGVKWGSPSSHSKRIEPSAPVPPPPPIPTTKNYAAEPKACVTHIERIGGSALNKMYMKKSL